MPKARAIAELFDVRENWHALFHRAAAHEPVIDGIRALAICWVISFHLLLGSLTTVSSFRRR